jgi:ribosomal protein L37AE/L43A
MKPTLALFPRDPTVTDACPECGSPLRFARQTDGDWIRCTECAWKLAVPDEPTQTERSQP